MGGSDLPVTMSGDDLDLSEFEDYSPTARAAAGRGGGGSGGGRRGGDRGDGSGGRRRRWPWLVAGVALGAAAALFLPDLVAPYLPEALRPGREAISGAVLAKRTEGDRLLLTVNTPRGAMLATFRRQVAEIDLLVEEGDTVTLGIDGYAALIEEPELEAVRKGSPRPRSSDGGRAGPEEAPDERPSPPRPEGESESAPDPEPAGADSGAAADSAPAPGGSGAS